MIFPLEFWELERRRESIGAMNSQVRAVAMSSEDLVLRSEVETIVVVVVVVAAEVERIVRPGDRSSTCYRSSHKNSYPCSLPVFRRPGSTFWNPGDALDYKS